MIFIGKDGKEQMGILEKISKLNSTITLKVRVGNELVSVDPYAVQGRAIVVSIVTSSGEQKLRLCKPLGILNDVIK
jgi:hypothetical protein